MVLTPIGGVIYRLFTSSLIKTECHDITEIFLKVAIQHHKPTTQKNYTEKTKKLYTKFTKKCTKNTYEK